MRVPKRNYLAIVTGLMAGIPCVGAPIQMDMQEAVKRALGTRPAHLTAQLDTVAAKARRHQAQASWYPTVTPSATYVYSRARTQLPGFGTATGVTDETRYEVGADWLLWDNGRRELRIAQAKHALTSAELSLEQSKHSVTVEAVQAFLDMLRQQELARSQQASLERALALQQMTEAQVEAGALPRKDLLQARADAANARVSLLQTQNRLKQAETRLKLVTGVPWDAELTLTPPAASPDVPSSLDLCRQLAEQHRPDIAIARQSLRIRQLAHQMTVSDAGLNIQARSGAGYRFKPDRGDTVSVSLVASYPLFDGGLNAALIQESRTAIATSELQLVNSRLEAFTQVEQAWLEHINAEERLTAATSALEAAQANYEAASAGRAEGVGTVIDVVTANASLAQAEASAVQARYDLLLAVIQLRVAIGSTAF